MTVALVAFAAPRARAEGVGEQTTSTSASLRGATTVRPTGGGGLVSLGGSALRHLARGSRQWETLHRQAGDNLYRVEGDDSGRLLAAWENDPFIHAFTLEPRQHVSIPKPPVPPDVAHLSVERLVFLPDGRDALVFMTGMTKQPGSPRVTAAYRIPLDGKQAPTLLFRVDDAYLVHTSRYGAVFMEPQRSPRHQCYSRDCRPIAALVAYELSGDGVRRKTLLTREQVELRNALWVRGSNDERLVLMLELVRQGRALLRWRYGDEEASYRPLNPLEATSVSLVTPTDEYIELRERDTALEVVRYPPEGGEQVTSLPSLHGPDTQTYGLGMRSNGALWLHWGDHLVLLTPGKPPRSFSIEKFLERRTEWAGADIYVQTPPESLWVGIDGRGRNFVRVGFDELEKRAKPWR